MDSDLDTEILEEELARLEKLAEGGTNFTYALMYHRLAALIRERTAGTREAS